MQPIVDLVLDAARRAPETLEAGALASACIAVQRRAIERAMPAERGALVTQCLMSSFPSRGLLALRDCGGLKRLLPEIEGLFGVPQLSDGPQWVDVGQHQLRLADVATREGLPLAARFAALMHKIGKAGTPREIWPHHYKHEQRAHALLDAMAQRLALPAEAWPLAHLVVDECERVHRASDMRAGPIAAMLQRLQALEQPERFEQLLAVCTCDYAAYEGHDAAEYPKAPRLRRALAAYAAVDAAGLGGDEALEARAQAIARALGSHARLG